MKKSFSFVFFFFPQYFSETKHNIKEPRAHYQTTIQLNLASWALVACSMHPEQQPKLNPNEGSHFSLLSFYITHWIWFRGRERADWDYLNTIFLMLSGIFGWNIGVHMKVSSQQKIQKHFICNNNPKYLHHTAGESKIQLIRSQSLA